VARRHTDGNIQGWRAHRVREWTDVTAVRPLVEQSAAGALTSRGRIALIAGALAGLYALGALLPFWFLTSPEAGAAFFPPAGLTLAILVLTPRNTWKVWIAVIVAVELAVDLTHGQSVGLALGFAAANAIEPVVGAAALRSPIHRPTTLRGGFLRYIATAVVLGPLVGAFIASTALALSTDSGYQWLEVFGRWALGDALGVIVVGGLILTWARPRPYDMRFDPRQVMGFACLAISVTVVPALLWHHPLIYAVLPVLIWSAMQGGTRAVTAVGFAVAFAADWVAVTGHAGDLVAASDNGTALVFVQLFLAVTLLTAQTFAVEVTERLRVEHLSRQVDAARARAELSMVTTAADERQRIAQEMHDIVGHALNVMLLQAGAARRRLADDPDKALDLLESIATTGRAAFRDLDVALGLMDQAPDPNPARGLADVPGLLDGIRRAGVTVTLTLVGTPRMVSTLVDWSAYRIIQESLTNVVKHAPGSHTDVTIEFAADELKLSVVDDGVGPSSAELSGGRGLVGMRERTIVLGGTLEAGRESAIGFAVRACLPAPDDGS
jgi:signal transduction histidine kinase